MRGEVGFAERCEGKGLLQAGRGPALPVVLTGPRAPAWERSFLQSTVAGGSSWARPSQDPGSRPYSPSLEGRLSPQNPPGLTQGGPVCGQGRGSGPSAGCGVSRCGTLTASPLPVGRFPPALTQMGGCNPQEGHGASTSRGSGSLTGPAPSRDRGGHTARPLGLL